MADEISRPVETVSTATLERHMDATYCPSCHAGPYYFDTCCGSCGTDLSRPLVTRYYDDVCPPSTEQSLWMSVRNTADAHLYIADHDCEHCSAKAHPVRCDECGREGWVTDCGHQTQPRDIAADGHHTYCDECYAEIRS